MTLCQGQCLHREEAFKLFIYLFIFGLFRAKLEAYGGLQARGWIGVVTSVLRHSCSNARSKRVCDPHHSSQQHQSLTYWARPGVEPVSSWMLVRFVSTELRQELPCTLLMGMQFGAATMENSVEVLNKSSNSTPGYIIWKKKTKTLVQKDTCSPMFVAA